MPARRQLLQKITLNANAANVTFSNIPQTYTDLMLSVSARTNRSLEVDGLYPRFNGDTNTANYSTRRVYGNGSSAVSDTTRDGVLFATGATATANTFGNSTLYIPNAFGSTAKAMLCQASSENNATAAYPGLTAALWTGTAAISSMSLTPEVGTAFIAGSTFYLYGITQVPVIVGGTETISGGYKIHTFTATSSLRVVEAGQVEYLVVAGGGGGGARFAGGGGAGGLLNGRMALSPGIQTVTVGAGGSGGASTGGPGVNGANDGSSGSNSVFNALTATGGGGGGAGDSRGGLTGGSGGGGAGRFGSGGGSGTAGQGTAGGGSNGSSPYRGGGGGGSGAAGGGGGTGTGAGGSGTNVWGTFYAGGGGGGGSADGNTGGGSGGSGGGGSGQDFSGSPAATAGATGTGSGGGGGAYVTAAPAPPGPNNGPGAAGGSGIVIIRYPYITN